MTFARMGWIGCVCCLGALLLQLFPEAAFRVGVDIGATWRLFAFGFFLIALSSLTSAGGRRGAPE